MARQLISSGSVFEAQIGYSRAVVTGAWVFVAGCTGNVPTLNTVFPGFLFFSPFFFLLSRVSKYDYKTKTLSSSIEEQVEQALQNVDAALKEAGANIADVVRVRYILPNRTDFPLCWPTLSRWFGNVRPAATMIQAGLMEEAMKFEIEVTARKASAEEG